MVKSKKNSQIYDAFNNIFLYLNNNVQSLNSSKLFAGLMIITLNIASKFTTVKLSKTMESYLKYTFSRNALVFVIAWMGSREIYIAFIITIIFIICMDYLFNEESTFCIFPESFKDYHIALLEENGPNKEVSIEEIKRAEEVLERAKKQNTQLQYQSLLSFN